MQDWNLEHKFSDEYKSRKEESKDSSFFYCCRPINIFEISYNQDRRADAIGFASVTTMGLCLRFVCRLFLVYIREKKIYWKRKTFVVDFFLYLCNGKNKRKKMQELIAKHIEKIKQIVSADKQEIENLRIEYLGKKGVMNDLFARFKEVAPEQRKKIGIMLNELKQTAAAKIEELKEKLEQVSMEAEKEDLSKPSGLVGMGSLHPLTLIRKEIIDIFSRIGYTVQEGPEIEDDWHVFSALNFPKEHPARDMQDTFFVENGREDGNDVLLRTHTSSVQVRTMEKMKPPIRIIAPGRVFRNEAISARAHCIFHQVEGLYIDKDVSFADLKQNLLYFVKEMFGEKTEIRLRPSYFPFTEPSAEMDISCTICGGKGCNICKHTGWLEIMGCGMVDPNVLEASGIDSKVYSGFAFGMGIERIAMLKYDVKDLRQYFENDIRFLDRFSCAY